MRPSNTLKGTEQLAEEALGRLRVHNPTPQSVVDIKEQVLLRNAQEGAASSALLHRVAKAGAVVACIVPVIVGLGMRAIPTILPWAISALALAIVARLTRDAYAREVERWVGPYRVRMRPLAQRELEHIAALCSEYPEFRAIAAQWAATGYPLRQEEYTLLMATRPWLADRRAAERLREHLAPLEHAEVA